MEEELSDNNLLNRFKTGDNEAFYELLKRYEKPITGYLFGISRNMELSRDVCQETFLKLIHTPPRFFQKGSLKAWLFKAAKNLIIDHIRRDSKMVHSDENRKDMDSSPNPYQAAEAADDFRELHSIIDELKPEYRDVVIMHFFSRQTFREIAEIQKIPLGTALWRMNKAISLIQEKYENRTEKQKM